MPEDSGRRVLMDHLGLAVGAFAALTIAARLLAVSHFSPTTAYALLSTIGTDSLVVGSLLSILPTLLTIGAVMATVAAYLKFRSEGSWLSPQTFGALAVGLLALALVPWPWLSLLPLAAIFLFLDYTLHKSGLDVEDIPAFWPIASLVRRLPVQLRKSVSLIPRVGIALLLVAMGLTGFLSAPLWLPPERLSLASGETLPVYVLSQDDEEIVVLSMNDRHVERYAFSDVVGREYCTPDHVDPIFGLPVLYLMLFDQAPNYPSCCG